MPYYPTFAFFAARPSLADIARSLVIDLDPDFILGLELKEAGTTRQLVQHDAHEALRLLEGPAGEITEFSMSKPIHSMTGRLTTEGYLELEFWDFDDEIFDETGAPSEEQKKTKYDIALMLHRSLVQRSGALLSYTSGSDSQYAGPVDHYDQAGTVATALRAGDYEKIFDVLDDVELPWMWVLSLNRSSELTERLATQFRRAVQEIERTDKLLLFEKRSHRPFFLR